MAGPTDPYAVLGVSPRASVDEITAAYRTLAQIYHPDRYVDAPENVQREAERRMQELNQAYSLARKGAPVNGGSGVNSAWVRAEAERIRKGPVDLKLGVPWEKAVRERAMQAARAREARIAKERAAPNGQARPRPRPARQQSVMAGLGEAMYTNYIRCRTCQSIQWLPDGWQQRLSNTNYHCSSCDRLILAR